MRRTWGLLWVLVMIGVVVATGVAYASDGESTRDLIKTVMNLGIWVVLMVVGYTAGTTAERNHLASLLKREQGLRHMPAFPGDYRAVLEPEDKIASAQMVTGEVCLTDDFFREFCGNLKHFFGGNLRTHAVLLERARREAILRLKERALGADLIANLRLETSMLNEDKGKKATAALQVIAYGAAIYLEKATAS